MVQVIPQAPSLGELLGAGMGQGMQQRLEQMRQGQGLSQILGLDQDQAQAFSSMNPQIQQAIAGPMIKQKMKSQLVNQLFGGSPGMGQNQRGKTEQPPGIGQGDMGGIPEGQDQPPYSAQEVSRAYMLNSDAGKGMDSANTNWYKQQKLAMAKQASTGLVPPEKATALLDTIKDMEEIIPYTGHTQVPFTKSFWGGKGGLNRTALEKRSEFDTLSISLESFFRDQAAKGNLPGKIFDALMERLPDSKISERENKGRLNAIKKIIGRHLPKQGQQSQTQEATPDKSFSVGKTFDKLPPKAPDKTYIKDEKGNLYVRKDGKWSKA